VSCLQYEFKSHPTKYKNVLFRSRLEARWAAFFDLVNWKWDYEPVDLEGWTPDFMIRVPRFSPKSPQPWVYAEVKPFNDLSLFNALPVGKRWREGARGEPGLARLGLGPDHSAFLSDFDGSGAKQWTICVEEPTGLFGMACWWECFNPPIEVKACWALAGNAVMYQRPKNVF